MYDAKLSSRSVIHDSAGSAGRTMAEDLENPEDKVRDNTISVRRSKQFMRTVTAPARSPRRTSHRHRLHRLGGGCAASRAPATHCRGRLGPIQYDPRRFRNCGARSPEPLAGAGAGARGGGAVLSLTLSSGFSKSSAIVRPAEPALSLITLRLESFARVHSTHPTLVRRERAVSIRHEKFMKIY